MSRPIRSHLFAPGQLPFLVEYYLCETGERVLSIEVTDAGVLRVAPAPGPVLVLLEYADGVSVVVGPDEVCVEWERP